MYTVSMTHTYCKACKTTKPDSDFAGVVAPFTCIACNTGPVQHGQNCASCGQFRPLKSFRYPLTLAQAEARGYYNHEARPMHAYSKLCLPCRTHQKRGSEIKPRRIERHLRPSDLPELTRAQLQVELTRGLIKPSLVEAEIARRQRNEERDREERGLLGAEKRWGLFGQRRHKWLLGEIKRELLRVANKVTYTRHAAQHSHGVAQAKLKFFIAYRAALKQVRRTVRQGLLTIKDGECTWGELVGMAGGQRARRLEHLLARWDAVNHFEQEEHRDRWDAVNNFEQVKRRPGRPQDTPLLIARRREDIYLHCETVLTRRKNKPTAAKAPRGPYKPGE